MPINSLVLPADMKVKHVLHMYVIMGGSKRKILQDLKKSLTDGGMGHRLAEHGQFFKYCHIQSNRYIANSLHC